MSLIKNKTKKNNDPTWDKRTTQCTCIDHFTPYINRIWANVLSFIVTLYKKSWNGLGVIGLIVSHVNIYEINDWDIMYILGWVKNRSFIVPVHISFDYAALCERIIIIIQHVRSNL